MNEQNLKLGLSAARKSIIINILLAAFKLFAGIFANSVAMISDAAHSIIDLLSTSIAMIGMKLSSKKADSDHPYGHERFECVAAIILSVLVLFTGLGIGYTGIMHIINTETTYAPEILALIAAVVSILVKEGIYHYQKRVAKKIDSSALLADAEHSRIDGLSSFGSLVGIGGAMLGFVIMDSIAAIIISAFILRAGIKIFTNATGKMTDKSASKEFEEEVKQLTLESQGVLGIDLIKTRVFGNKIYIDIEISVCPKSSLITAHKIAHAVHNSIEEKFEKVKHCMVHVNPFLGGEEVFEEIAQNVDKA